MTDNKNPEIDLTLTQETFNVNLSEDKSLVEIHVQEESVDVSVEEDITTLDVIPEVFAISPKEDTTTIFPAPLPYGLVGPKGDTGPSGPHGGEKGDTGVPGTDGTDGINGAKGDTGIDGTTYYTNPDPVPVTLGGINAGESFDHVSIPTMFDKLLYPYQFPAFSSFSFPQSPNPLEVGQSISGGVKTFTWATSNAINVQTNSISITDTTTSTLLASSLANTGSFPISISPITNTTNTSHSWQIAGLNTHSGSFTRSFSIPWQWAIYYGESITTPLTATDIKNLRVKVLSPSSAGTYVFIAAAFKYKYISYPTALGLKTSFKDPSTNLDVAMSPVYSVSVTNTYGITTPYYVHRTLNQLGGSLTIVVS